jgi:hypothetical protein
MSRAGRPGMQESVPAETHTDDDDDFTVAAVGGAVQSLGHAGDIIAVTISELYILFSLLLGGSPRPSPAGTLPTNDKPPYPVGPSMRPCSGLPSPLLSCSVVSSPSRDDSWKGTQGEREMTSTCGSKARCILPSQDACMQCGKTEHPSFLP